MRDQLTGDCRNTYDALFGQPPALSVPWSDVQALLAALADELHVHNGTLKASLNNRSLMLHQSPGRTDLGPDEMAELRRFLEKCGADAASAAGQGHFMVVIDHREARVFKTELHGSTPRSITPYDPHGYGRTLHSVNDDANGQRKPERRSFYDAVAKTLKGAGKILLLGSGTGSSSAMEQLLAELKLHHKDLAARVAGSLVVNEQHLTDDQLLARAREFYATPVATTPG